MVNPPFGQEAEDSNSIQFALRCSEQEVGYCDLEPFMFLSVLDEHRVVSRQQQRFFLCKMLSGTDSHFVEKVVKLFAAFGACALQAFCGLCT